MKVNLWVLVDNHGRICYTSNYEVDCMNYASIHDLTSTTKVIELKGEF